jgi:hypothetical protein
MKGSKKVLTLLGAVAVTGAIVAAAASTGGPASAKSAANGVRGEFSLILMVHTLASIPQFNVPATTPWNGRLLQGRTFSYRSIPCTGNAPVNNISSDLPSYNTRVQGSRAPSSLRGHPFQFRLVKVKKRWELQGTMTVTVCKLNSGPTPNPDPIPDQAKPKIFVTFRAPFKRMTAESVQWAGTFRLTGGTQRYAGLRGSGRIAGYFFCFAAEGCTAEGALQDLQFVMHGTYSDPTPQLNG